MAINLNKASVEDLRKIEALSGTRRAEQIIEWRNEHGPFKSWDDIDKIPGFTPHMVDELKKAGATIG